MEQKPAGENPEDIAPPPEIILSPPTTGSTEPGPNRVCPGCGTVNSPTAVYCAKCGLKLPEVVAQSKKICAGCGAANSPASQYCYKCGLQLQDKLGSSYELRYGGFWIRLLAFIINGILLYILISIISVVIFMSKYGQSA
jgi:ribosomal protein L40E